MRYLLMLALLSVAFSCLAFDCQPFGPQGGGLNCADLNGDPLCFGGSDCIHGTVFLLEGASWNSYPHYSNLPLLDLCRQGDDALLTILGAGSYSDGVYSFDLDSHAWDINHWFFWPNFICHYPANGDYYVGESLGLFHSPDGLNWYGTPALGEGPCTSLAFYGDHLVTNWDNAVYYSPDAGQTWQQSTMILLKGFRFDSEGTLYAFMNAGSDSDGLWRSQDFGDTWNVVLYSTGLSCIGPDFGGEMPLGWNQPNEYGHWLELVNSSGQLTPLQHPSLASAVKELENFPLINTPSFYVINAQGCFYLTGFMTPLPDEEEEVPISSLDFSLSPNPAADRVTLQFSGQKAGRVEVSIHDLKGRKVFSQEDLEPGQASLELALPQLPAGIYFVRASDGISSTTRKLTLW